MLGKNQDGLLFKNKLYKWGSVGAVITFPKISIISKLRYILHAARCLIIKDWNHLDNLTAQVG